MTLIYLLRSGEYVETRGARSPFIIQVADVTASTRDGRIARSELEVDQVQLRLRGSKTDQEGREVLRSLRRSSSAWLCPVKAVWALLENAHELRLLPTDPLCSVVRNQVLSAAALSARLKEAAQNCGIESDRVATHSLRSGGAPALYDADVGALVLKQFGRWCSSAVERTPGSAPPLPTGWQPEWWNQTKCSSVAPMRIQIRVASRLHAQPRRGGASSARHSMHKFWRPKRSRLEKAIRTVECQTCIVLF